MLQDVPNNTNLTATSLPTLLTVESTLSFDRTNGKFTFSLPTGSSTQDITGAFLIPVTATGSRRVAVNAGQGIEFLPIHPSSGPVDFLPFNNSGVLTVVSFSATRIEIDVTTLPVANGVLGFVLFLQLTMDSPTVQGIETPPFLVTLDQPVLEPHITLQYTPNTGQFTLQENGVTLPGSIRLEKGLVILRINDGSSAPPSNIRVSLGSGGMVFANPAAKFNPSSGASFQRISDTEILVTRDFTPGTWFCMSFGVELLISPNETCTIYSPDPIIVDKQIGGTG